MLACNLDDVESRLGGGFRTCRRKGGLEKIGRGEDVQRRPSLIWRENHATFMVDVEASRRCCWDVHFPPQVAWKLSQLSSAYHVVNALVYACVSAAV